MDNLPDHLIIEILSRLNDSFELARCKCVSKTLNALARQVRSIHLYCSLDRYSKMRWCETRFKVTPFKEVFLNLISEAQVPIESVSLRIDKYIYRSLRYDLKSEKRRADLFLTHSFFSNVWLAKIGHGLKSISISDSIQSCNKVTDFFHALSNNCHSLVELKLKNASLCRYDIRVMPLLTRVTLKQIKISDKNLNKLMECLPCLQVLKLIISGGGGPDIKIHHLNLKELNWGLNSCESSSSLSIFAPSLTKLDLQCCYILRISIHAPLLSYCNLDPSRVDLIDVEKFKTLETLRLVSWDLHNILSTFPSCLTVQNLTFGSLRPENDSRLQLEKIEFSHVSTIFPNVASLTLGPEVWSQLMVYPLLDSVAKDLKDLKHITAYLVHGDIDKTFSFILYIAGICSKLTNMVLFFHRDDDMCVAISFVLSCMSKCPKVRFRWGTWREGTKDCCISNSIYSAANTV